MTRLTWEEAKDPNEELPYQINWLPRLKDENGIQVATIDTSIWWISSDDDDSMLIMGATEHSATRSTVWLTGGTLGMRYALTNRVAADNGWLMDQTAWLKIRTK